MQVRATESLIHRESHHLNPWVQGKFGSGVPGSLTSFCLVFLCMTNDIRSALRDSHRQARQALDSNQQAAAAQSLLELIRGQDFYHRAQHIAFFQAMDGEIDPAPLLADALQQNKSCYLPVISASDPEFIAFAPYDENTSLTRNEWGISEPPQPKDATPPTTIDLVFVPLVAFDNQCFRLGMGKGFYDRTFSFKIFNRRSQPLLVGLAHECQYATESFPVASWDVRLDAVATAEKIYRPDTA